MKESEFVTHSENCFVCSDSDAVSVDDVLAFEEFIRTHIEYEHCRLSASTSKHLENPFRID